jgi:hypothetical protein
MSDLNQCPSCFTIKTRLRRLGDAKKINASRPERSISASTTENVELSMI